MKKILLFPFLFFFISTASMAGNKKTTAVKGHVVDLNGSPIIGAKVIIEGIDTTIYTDFNGAFFFRKVPKANTTIRVSMISYEEKKSAVNFEEAPIEQDLSIVLSSK